MPRLIYAQWLTYAPVLQQAATQLKPDAFREFLDEAFRDKAEGLDIGNDHLSWYLFEEVGWPEGRITCHAALISAKYDQLRSMVSPEAIAQVNPEGVISPRIESRRLRSRKPGKRQIMRAHFHLLRILNRYLLQAQ